MVTPTAPAPAPVSGIDAAFYPACWKVGLALGLSPEKAGYGIAQILYSESGIQPGVTNSIGCVGINQFCPGSFPSGITPGAYKQLTASQQLLQYVYPFWAARARAVGGISRPVDLYWLNFYPATFKKNAPGNYVVNPHIAPIDYGLSRNKTYATVDDLQAFLDRVDAQAKWQAIKKNLAPYAVPSLAAIAGVSTWVSVGIIGAAAAFWWFELRGPRGA